MQVLYHDDDNQVKVAAGPLQDTGFMSVDDGAKRRLLISDQINYIDCGKVDSEEVMIDLGSPSGFLFPNGHAIIANTIVQGDGSDDTDLLFHNDDDQVDVVPSDPENKGFLNVDDGARRLALVSDQINYIDCGKVDSDEVSIDINSEAGFRYPEGHMVKAKELVNGVGEEETAVLYHEDASSVREYSSVDQFNSFLSVDIGGMPTPVEFDVVDYIDCGKVASHSAIMDNGSNIGYLFSDGFHEVITDQYPLFDTQGVELKELPKEMGEGFYESFVDEQTITNFDDGSALGLRSNNVLRVGQHYFLADDILPASDID